jgi:hypothetical protein
MTYPSNLEKVYQVRYSTFNNGNVDFIEDENEKWEFDTLDEAIEIYLNTIEKKEHEWVAITKTLKISEDEFNELYPNHHYPDYIILDDYEYELPDETDEEDETDDETDE